MKWGFPARHGATPGTIIHYLQGRVVEDFSVNMLPPAGGMLCFFVLAYLHPST